MRWRTCATDACRVRLFSFPDMMAAMASNSVSVTADRRAAEAALHAAEARLRSILETVPDAMVIIDERGLIESLSATAERLFGYSAGEVVGKNVSLFMPSPHRQQPLSHHAPLRAF